MGSIMKYKYFIILFFIFLSFQAAYAADNHNISNLKANFLDFHKYTFNSTDLIKDYNNQSQYNVQILKDGKSIGPNHQVMFRVNGFCYNRMTDCDGIATLNIRLNPGQYIVYVEYDNAKNYNNILVLSN